MTLPAKCITLIPDRLVMGPMPNKKSITVKQLLLEHDIGCFINLTKEGRSHWYMPGGTLKYDLQVHAIKGKDTLCYSLEMNSEEPLKEDIIFKFVSKIAQKMNSPSVHYT